MKRILLFIFSITSTGLIYSNVNAALGLPENTARLGYSLGVARLDIDDPAGVTASAYAIQPLKFIYSDWWRDGNRFWFELFYQQANFSAEENEVGQYVRRSGVNLLIQKNLAVNSFIRPWFGAGVGVSAAEYQKRYIADDEGYLLESFPDRKTGSLGILFSVANEWKISRDSTIGGSFLQRISLNNTMTESLLSVFFLVRY